MNKWQRVDDGSVVTKTGFRTVVHKTFVMNSGKIMHADISGGEDNAAACVIAVTTDNKIIIAKQFRCGPERVMYEMPGGAVDPGETPEQAARRELAEEVGYEADNFEYLGAAYINAWDATIHHYFLAKNCRFVGAHNPEEFEEIEMATISIAEFIENAKQARMTDAQGVLLAYEKLRALEGAS